MTATPLVDLSPILQVMLAGAALAAVPIGWLWLRRERGAQTAWIGKLTLLTLFLTFDLVLFGAFTRLTDSGLGCPDWPGCYGSASPHGARGEIGVAQSAMPSGPVTHGKAWIEMVHRYMATAVGVLILILAGAGWRAFGRKGKNQVPQGPWWPTFTLVWVCIQGGFGALTVTMKLFPAIVTLHLLGGLMLLVLLCIQSEAHDRWESGRARIPLDTVTRGLLLATCALLAVQLALGGWVSTNYAVLACTDFPMCQNSWWPEMRFDEGFQVWRELGLTQDGVHISFAGLTAIHFVHRCMAILVLTALGWLAWRLNATAGLRVQAAWLAALSVLQLASGLGNVVLGWPLAAALLHTGGAAALVVVMTWAVARSRAGTRPASAARLGASDVAA